MKRRVLGCERVNLAARAHCGTCRRISFFGHRRTSNFSSLKPCQSPMLSRSAFASRPSQCVRLLRSVVVCTEVDCGGLIRLLTAHIPLPQMLGFLNSLCGPRATELKVKDKEAYAFNPRKLIDTITTIVLRIWKQESSMATNSFTRSMALHSEYSAATMSHVGSLLSRDNPGGGHTFLLLIQNVCYGVGGHDLKEGQVLGEGQAVSAFLTGRSHSTGIRGCP